MATTPVKKNVPARAAAPSAAVQAAVNATASAPAPERRESTGADFNQAVFIGNAKAAPTMSALTSGGVTYKVAELTLAVATKVGKEVRTQWQTVRAIGQTAELLERYVKAGTQLSVVGPSMTSLYASPSKIKRSAVEGFIRQFEEAGQTSVSLEALRSFLGQEDIKATDRGQHFAVSQFGLLGRREADDGGEAAALDAMSSMEVASIEA
jgi:hypothetical protein